MDREKRMDLLSALALAAAGVFLFWLSLRYLLGWLLPFFIAFLLAALAEPAIRWCRERLGFRRGFTAAVFSLVLVLTLFLAVFWLFSQLMTQAYGFLEQLPALLGRVPDVVDGIQQRAARLTAACPQELRLWLQSLGTDWVSQGASAVTELSGSLLGELTAFMGQLPHGVLFLVTTLLAVFYTTCHYPAIRAFLFRQLPDSVRGSARGVQKSIYSTLVKWLRAELTLSFITFLQLLIGLLLLREPYALLWSFLIAIVDALPILGTGTVLIPWAVVALLGENLPKAIGLLALYAVILLVRSLMEPKLMADQVGLPPIASLLAMYLGYSTMGILGMLLFPVLLLLVKQLHDAGYLRLWK